MIHRLAFTLVIGGVVMATVCQGKKKGEAPIEVQSSQEKIVPVPTADSGAEKSKQFVYGKLALIDDATKTSAEKAEAIKSLIPYAANFASVATKAVQLAKESEDVVVLTSVANLLAKSKLSSPSIVEAEIAIYYKMLEKNITDARLVIVESMTRKMQNDVNLLTSVKVRQLQRDMIVKETDEEIQLLSLDTYKLENQKLAQLEKILGGTEALLKFTINRYSDLFYIASLGALSFQISETTGRVEGIATHDNSLAEKIADGTVSTSLAITNKAVEVGNDWLAVTKDAYPVFSQHFKGAFLWVAQESKKVPHTAKEKAVDAYFGVGSVAYKGLKALGVID